MTWKKGNALFFRLVVPGTFIMYLTGALRPLALGSL